MTGTIGVEHLPGPMLASPGVMSPVKDRRHQVADDLYEALVKQSASFWEHVYPLFLARDITRHDLRELVRRGLQKSQGRYKEMIKLFGMSSRDYRRFMNFLAAHGCRVEFREFRATATGPGTSSVKELVPDDAAESPATFAPSHSSAA